MLGVVAGLAVLAEGADIGARHLATSKVEQRVAQRVPEASGVHARIRSWPFLKVAVSGDVDEVAVTLSRVVERPIVFSDVAVDLRGVRLSVTDLVTNGGVSVTRIRTGTVSVAVTDANLIKAITSAVPAAGVLLRRGLPPDVKVTVDAGRRALVVRAAGVGSQSLPLPGSDILPCTPTVTQIPGRTVLSCTFNQVPAAFTTVSR